MASGRRSESLKHLLTVALGKEETDMPYQLIVGKFKCRSPADLAKIKPEKFEAKFVFIDEDGDETLAELAEAEIMELCDLQELVKAHKSDPNKDWSQVTEDEFNQFRDDLVDDADMIKAQTAAAAQAAAAATSNAQPNTGGGVTSMLTAYKMKRVYSDYKRSKQAIQ
jgi:acetoin utilization deacetylase AcuC-like enzyme